MSVSGSEWDVYDDSLDPQQSTRSLTSSMYARLSDPTAIDPYLKQNEMEKRDVSLTWGESFDAAWTGAMHGLTTYGPEQLYRAARSLARIGGNLFDTSGIEAWATEGINSQLREREIDPWYQPDPRWMESEWGRSLYGGFSSFTSSMMSFLPGAAVAAAAAPFSGGTSLGALLFSGAAYLAGSGASSGVAGLAAYDQFMEEAYQAAKAVDPTVTYETIASEKFMSALLTGVSESGTEFVGDLIGGKLAGIIGKNAGEQVLGVFGRTMKNMVNNMATEIGSEAANAAIQDYIREVNEMSHEGRMKAIFDIIGPTAVAGALGGIQQTLGGTGKQQTPAEIENALRASDVARRRSVLAPESAALMERMSATSTDHGQTAFETALMLEAQARRISSETQEYLGDILNRFETTPELVQSMLTSLRNPDSTMQDVIAASYSHLESTLSDDARLRLWESVTTPEGTIDSTQLVESFQDFINDPKKATEKWNLSDDAVQSFTGMSNLLTDSINALAGDSSVHVSKGAQEYLSGRMDYQAPQSAGMRFRVQELNEVQARWANKDLSTQENMREFLGEALPHMELDLSAPGVPVTAEGIFRDTFLAYKPLLDKILQGSKRKSDVTTDGSAAKIVETQPGFDLFADTFKAVDGVDNQQAAIKMVLKISETHIQTLAKMIAAGDNTNTNLEFQATALLQNHQIMKDVDKGIGRELARALRRRRIDKADPRFTEKAQALMNSSRSPEARKLLWQAIANSDDQKSLEHNTSLPLMTRTVDAVMEYVTSNMLFGPSTHLVNIIGNTIQIVNKVIERGFGEFLLPQSAQGVQRGETIAMIQGFWQGFKTLREKWRSHRDQSDGLAQAVITSENMWAEGGTRADDAGMMHRAISSERFGLSREHGVISGGLATLVDLWGSFTHIPFALLNHSDQVFKHIYQQGAINALIVREAKGDKARLQELARNVPRDFIKQTREEATNLMFQGELDKVSRGLDQIRNAAPIFRFFLPFLKTPINVFKEGVSLTPVLSQFFGKVKQQLNSPDVATRQLAEAHVMLGNLIWTTALVAAAQGLLTGPAPEDPRERQKKEATGWLPNALKVGDTYIQLDRLDPVALILNSAAFLVQASDNLENEEIQTGMLTGIGQAMRILTNRTYLASVQDFMDFLSRPEKGVPDLLRRFGGSLVPAGSLGRTLNRTLDPFQREAQDIFSGLLQAVPGASKYLPQRRDFLGQKVASSDWYGPDWLSPFRMSKDNKDPLYAEVARLHHLGHSAAPMPSKDIMRGNNVTRMRPDEYAQFLDQYGNGVRINGLTALEALQREVRSNDYQSMPDSQRARRIKSTLARYSRQAKAHLVENNKRIAKDLGVKNQGWQYLFGNTLN